MIEVTYIARKIAKGSQFVKEYTVDRNGVPFARVEMHHEIISS